MLQLVHRKNIRNYDGAACFTSGAFIRSIMFAQFMCSLGIEPMTFGLLTIELQEHFPFVSHCIVQLAHKQR